MQSALPQIDNSLPQNGKKHLQNIEIGHFVRLFEVLYFYNLLHLSISLKLYHYSLHFYVEN